MWNFDANFYFFSKSHNIDSIESSNINFSPGPQISDQYFEGKELDDDLEQIIEYQLKHKKTDDSRLDISTSQYEETLLGGMNSPAKDTRIRSETPKLVHAKGDILRKAQRRTTIILLDLSIIDCNFILDN